MTKTYIYIEREYSPDIALEPYGSVKTTEIEHVVPNHENWPDFDFNYQQLPGNYVEITCPTAVGELSIDGEVCGTDVMARMQVYLTRDNRTLRCDQVRIPDKFKRQCMASQMLGLAIRRLKPSHVVITGPSSIEVLAWWDHLVSSQPWADAGVTVLPFRYDA